MVRNELIVAVGVEDAMDGDASELLRAQEPELAGYSSRERGARGSVAKPTILTDAIRGSGAAKGRDGRNVRVEYRFPKCLMEVREAGVGLLELPDVTPLGDANVGECLQHRKSALALATGIAGGNWVGDQSQRAKV